MPTTKEINRFNDLIGRELGRNQFGEGLYQWAYSENLLHPMCISDPHDRSTYDYGHLESGVLYPIPRYALRKLCPELNRQWLIVQWYDAGSEAAWRAMHGTRLEWPRRGYLAPTDVHLHPSEVPNTELTRMFIDCVKLQRTKTFADHMAEGERAEELRERRVFNEIHDDMKDTMTAFGKIPGSRNSGVSLPSAASTANHDAALSTQ